MGELKRREKREHRKTKKELKKKRKKDESSSSSSDGDSEDDSRAVLEQVGTKINPIAYRVFQKKNTFENKKVHVAWKMFSIFFLISLFICQGS